MEGPAGQDTELARAVAQAATDPVWSGCSATRASTRLASYEWKLHAKQTYISRPPSGIGGHQTDVQRRVPLLQRPLLDAIWHFEPTVLLMKPTRPTSRSRACCWMLGPTSGDRLESGTLTATRVPFVLIQHHL